MEGKGPIGFEAGNPGEHPPPPPPYSGYPPPPPSGYPPPPQVTTIIPGAVIVQQTVGQHPMQTNCRSCQQDIVTRIERKASTRTHLFAGLLCLFGCWPCVFLPYCMDSCLNVDHYCTNCGGYIGSYTTYIT